MDNPPVVERERSKRLLFVLVGVSALLTLVLGVAVFFFLHFRKSEVKLPPARTVAGAVQPFPEPEPGSLTNAVTILLGGDESDHGLKHVDTQRDGLTTIESIDGVPARVEHIGTHTALNFYFRIGDEFKQEDVRSVKIEVEYLDPDSGNMGIHYDALDTPAKPKNAYREADRPVHLSGSAAWHTATFHTKNDAAFSRRQNGQSDFRLWATTSTLYVRRVTVTRETAAPAVTKAAAPQMAWPVDFSTSNQVSILLGQEKEEDGVRHLAEERDGSTEVENLDGVVCRHLNLAARGKTFGYAYFTVSPTFKDAGLTNARVEVEYLARRMTAFRMQYGGFRDGAEHSYVQVVPANSRLVRWGPGLEYAQPSQLNTWAVATFHLMNVNFKNGQNGGADFRIEAAPPDLYLRRVTIMREEGSTPLPTRTPADP